MSDTINQLDILAAWAKRRGFIYPDSEIYGGLGGFYDYGPLGVAFKNNLKKHWWRTFVVGREDVFGLESSNVMHPKVWEASGHLAGFTDPLETDSGVERFNVMFATRVGASREALTAYLRPETAQGMFVNFKNVIDSFHPKLPFGLAQIGKAFRNEIAPREFLFRLREFEQMEIEYFVRPETVEEYFEDWRRLMVRWLEGLGLTVSEREVPVDERAHYSRRTIDFEYDFPFGRRELCGLARRGDFDLTAHARASGVDLSYFDEETKKRIIPEVIEPTFGLDRLVLAVLFAAYAEDELAGECRTVLRLPEFMAPIKAAVFPLLRNKPQLVAKAREIYRAVKERQPAVVFDDNGNIGKRYRRQDEIGTPYCLTIDFQTLEDGTITLRGRDNGSQERLTSAEAIAKLAALD